MNVIGFSGLHQNVEFKRKVFPGLSSREYRVAQGFDSAAALVCDSEIVAAAAEERFTREKATGSFPVNAIRYCLSAGRLEPNDVDLVAHSFAYEPFREFFVKDSGTKAQYDEVYSPDVQAENLRRFFPDTDLCDRLVPVNHHLAHAASVFFPSGFPEALILVSDGMGEVHSVTVAVGNGRDIQVIRHVPALHSLGILYGTFALFMGYFLGVDEYKIMGLAPYGDPRVFYDKMAGLVHLKEDGTYSIPIFARNITPLEKETHRGVLAALAELFGPPRKPGEELTQRDRDLAAALQAVFQQTQLHLLRHFRRETGLDRLCLAGGVALNCSANGVVARSRLFKEMFVQPAAGDDGSALGAALYVQNLRDPSFRPKRMKTPLWGPEFTPEEISAEVADRSDVTVDSRALGQKALLAEVAQRLGRGQIVAWFQGRMEYGPRALGSRSILADPRDPEMRDRINALVKKREAFRPFAPIVTKEAAAKYFDISPGTEDLYAHMLFVTSVKRPFRAQLPAITHVDGSARVQTVSSEHYPRLWALLVAFEEETGIPILLNTSFNVKGQPIVCTPREAIDTFLFSRLDLLVLESVLIEAKTGAEGAAAREAVSDRITLGVG